MKTDWDYTELADMFLKRPGYATSAIDRVLDVAGIQAGSPVCDVGAGTAHLTLELLRRGLAVTAIEPNDAMRAHGRTRTQGLAVTWVEGTGEDTRQSAEAFDLVTFGSSFNVTNRSAALKETARILRSGGWFACMWNHRDIDDPLQMAIEQIIRRHVPTFDYGSRREDQVAVIDASGLFKDVHRVEGKQTHRQTVADCVDAWRSHGTLQRQAGERFPGVVADIENLLQQECAGSLDVPYSTRVWLARVAK